MCVQPAVELRRQTDGAGVGLSEDRAGGWLRAWRLQGVGGREAGGARVRPVAPRAALICFALLPLASARIECVRRCEGFEEVRTGAGS
jgi:hypothetical protein